MSVRTEELIERLEAWQQLGLLSSAQAEAIAAHERARRGDAAPDGASPERRPGDRTTAAEAIGYVGAALVLGAVGLFVGEFWDGLAVGAQLALAALVTLSLAGAAVALRDAPAPPLRRLTSVLLIGVVGGVAWCTAITTDGLLGWSGDDTALAVGIAAVLVALPLYVRHARALPQLALLASVLTVLTALLARPDLTLDAFWYALPFAAVGVVWLVLGEGGYLAPRRLAAATGAVVALVALQVASFDDRRVLALVLALVLAGGLVAAAVALGGSHHLAVGALGLFVLVPQLVFELFGDAIGAPATLLLVGILLVLLAVGLGRARREVVTGGGVT